MTDTHDGHTVDVGPPADVEDPDHELVDRLLTLHPPASDEVAALMDAVRGNFISLGHTVVALVPRSPDREVALRKVHEACMASIAALACNQGLVAKEE